VRFLLDNEHLFPHAYPEIGNIHDRDKYGCTTMLAAAKSFCSWTIGEHDMAKHVSRSEQLMHMLLDVGASARDVIGWPEGTKPDLGVMTGVLWGETFTGTVLSLAIS
jgi:hypothetical protein